MLRMFLLGNRFQGKEPLAQRLASAAAPPEWRAMETHNHRRVHHISTPQTTQSTWPVALFITEPLALGSQTGCFVKTSKSLRS